MIKLGTPLERFRNVVGRTLAAFLPVFARPQDAYARAILTEAEYSLYRLMDVRDRAHAVAVTRRLIADYPDASDDLRRAALLHDVGKIGKRYDPWTRILVALYTPRDLAAWPRLRGLRGAWQIRRHHNLYGAEMVRAAGSPARVAEIVARHHHPGTDGEALQLQETDERF